MTLREEALIERARAALGIQPNAGENEIKYAYYRRMFKHHPDRNPTDPNAHEIASLIGEAYQVLMGKGQNQPFIFPDVSRSREREGAFEWRRELSASHSRARYSTQKK